MFGGEKSEKTSIDALIFHQNFGPLENVLM